MQFIQYLVVVQKKLRVYRFKRFFLKLLKNKTHKIHYEIEIKNLKLIFAKFNILFLIFLRKCWIFFCEYVVEICK